MATRGCPPQHCAQPHSPRAHADSAAHAREGRAGAGSCSYRRVHLVRVDALLDLLEAHRVGCETGIAGRARIGRQGDAPVSKSRRHPAGTPDTHACKPARWIRRTPGSACTGAGAPRGPAGWVCTAADCTHAVVARSVPPVRAARPGTAGAERRAAPPRVQTRAAAPPPCCRTCAHVDELRVLVARAPHHGAPNLRQRTVALAPE